MPRWLPKSGTALAQSFGKVPFNCFELGDLRPNNAQLFGDQVANIYTDLVRVTLNRKQLPYFVERKPELLGLLDKSQVSNLPVLIDPISPNCPLQPW